MAYVPKPAVTLPSLPPAKVTDRDVGLLMSAVSRLQKEFNLHEARLAEAQTKLDEVARTAHDIVITKRILTALVVVLGPMMIVGVISVAQGLARQEAISKDVDLQRGHVTALEQDVKGLRIDMGLIRAQNEGLQRDSKRILEALDAMRPAPRRKR